MSDPVPTPAMGISATVGRALEQMAINGAGPVAFPAEPWRAAEPLAGCTGVRGIGICIICDRLPQGGPQIHPKAKRGPDGVYRCGDQVVGGVHVGSVADESADDKHQGCGGVSTATPAYEGASE